MNKAPFEKPHETCRRDGATYMCVDGTQISCRYEVFEIDVETALKIDLSGPIIAPRNGILVQPDEPPVAVVSGTQTSREMGMVICGNSSKTYAFPSTTTIVRRNAS